MDLGLKGRTVLVMAGTRGIGFASAQAYAAEGANVVLCGRAPDSVARAAAALPDTLCLEGDVTDAEDMARIVAAGEARFGGIDILVGCCQFSANQSPHDARGILSIAA